MSLFINNEFIKGIDDVLRTEYEVRPLKCIGSTPDGKNPCDNSILSMVKVTYRGGMMMTHQRIGVGFSDICPQCMCYQKYKIDGNPNYMRWHLKI